MGDNQNVRHNPREIFENHLGGQSTVKVTKADFFIQKEVFTRTDETIMPLHLWL